MQQVMLNLMQNAIEAMHQNHPEKRINLNQATKPEPLKSPLLIRGLVFLKKLLIKYSNLFLQPKHMVAEWVLRFVVQLLKPMADNLRLTRTPMVIVGFDFHYRFRYKEEL